MAAITRDPVLLEYVSLETDDEQVQALFDADADVYGQPSLFARALANNPAVLAARQEYVSALTDAGVLEEELIELVYAAVATAIECEYCVESHTDRLVEHLGLDQSTVEVLAPSHEVELDQFLDDRTRTVVTFAREVATDPKRISTVDIQELRDCQFDDAEIVELVMVASAAVSATAIADTLNILPQDGEALPDFE